MRKDCSDKEGFYPNSIYCFFLTYQREPEDAEQLDDEPGGEQRYSDKSIPM